MKKLLIFIGCFTFLLISIVVVNHSQTQMVSTNNCSGYAVVKNNNAYFYRYTLENPTVNNKYFLLEKSYFVKIIEVVDDKFYKATYQNLTGYVKKIDVELVEEIPTTPFLENVTFDIISSNSVELRLEPTTKNGIGSIITTLPKSSKNLTYIGKITGEESIKGLGNIWYFCSYQTSNGNEIFGYVYSPLTTNLSPINENTENLTIATAINFVPLESLLYLNLSTKTLIIIVITLPILLLLYLFIKPTKILKQ